MSQDRELKNAIFEAAQAARAGAERGGLQEVSMSDAVRQEFGIEIPVAEVPLPSGGKVYPATSVLANLETLPIRAMTAKEEDIMMNDYFAKKGIVISELIKSVCQLRGFDPMDMVVGDRNAVMVGVRIVGYGSKYKAEMKCPSCGKLEPVEIDLNELDLVPLEIEPAQPNSNLFSFTLPVSKKNVQFRLLTGHDEREMMEEMDIKKKKGLQNTNLSTSRVLRQLVSVENITDRNALSKFVQALPIQDSKALRNYINKHQPDIKMQFFFECSGCGHVEKEAPLPMGVGFFWPDE
jgi:hypothetical protein